MIFLCIYFISLSFLEIFYKLNRLLFSLSKRLKLYKKKYKKIKNETFFFFHEMKLKKDFGSLTNKLCKEMIHKVDTQLCKTFLDAEIKRTRI